MDKGVLIEKNRQKMSSLRKKKWTKVYLGLQFSRWITGFSVFRVSSVLNVSAHLVSSVYVSVHLVFSV